MQFSETVNYSHKYTLSLLKCQYGDKWQTKAFFPIQLVHKDTAMVNSIREKEVLCSWLFVCCLKMNLILTYFLFSIDFKNSFLSFSQMVSSSTSGK